MRKKIPIFFSHCRATVTSTQSKLQISERNIVSFGQKSYQSSKILPIFKNLTLTLQMGLTAEYNKKNECFREIAGGAMKVKNQRPLAPSNLRGGANMQWGNGLSRTPTHKFQFMCEPSAEPSLLELCRDEARNRRNSNL